MHWWMYYWSAKPYRNRLCRVDSLVVPGLRFDRNSRRRMGRQSGLPRPRCNCCLVKVCSLGLPCTRERMSRREGFSEMKASMSKEIQSAILWCQSCSRFVICVVVVKGTTVEAGRTCLNLICGENPMRSSYSLQKRTILLPYCDEAWKASKSRPVVCDNRGRSDRMLRCRFLLCCEN